MHLFRALSIKGDANRNCAWVGSSRFGKRDIIARSNLLMWQFHKSVTFSSVDALTFSKKRPLMISNILATVMNLVAEKKSQVLQPFQAFGIAEFKDVLRLSQSGQNSGKMVVEMRTSFSRYTVYTVCVLVLVILHRCSYFTHLLLRISHGVFPTLPRH